MCKPVVYQLIYIVSTDRYSWQAHIMEVPKIMLHVMWSFVHTLIRPCFTVWAVHNFFPQETRRQQQAEAAERRMKQQESKGIKDPEALKRKQQKMEAAEKAASQTQGDGGLKVSNTFVLLSIRSYSFLWNMQKVIAASPWATHHIIHLNTKYDSKQCAVALWYLFQWQVGWWMAAS